MKLRWSAALGALGCALVVAACKDIPVLPQWSADWYVPLPSQRINLDSAATAQFGFDSVPPNTSFPFSWTLSQEMNGAIGELLKKDIVDGHIIMTLTKSSANLQLGFRDTLVVSGSRTGTPPGTIVFGLNMLPTDVSVVDTIPLDSTNIGMLSAVANSTTNDTLYVRIKGSGYTGASWVRLSGDTLAVRAALLARVAVSQ